MMDENIYEDCGKVIKDARCTPRGTTPKGVLGSD